MRARVGHAQSDSRSCSDKEPSHLGIVSDQPDRQRKVVWLVGSIIPVACSVGFLTFGPAVAHARSTTSMTTFGSPQSSLAAQAFPLGVAGVAKNPDGSYTLWVLNTQKPLVINGYDAFAIIDVSFTSDSGARFSLKSGNDCDLTALSGASTIECVPEIEPGSLVPLV